MARLPGPLCAPPLEGRSIGPGGGEPPPPVFPQIKYFCSLEGAYCEALGHGDVRQGGGVETRVAEGVEGAGDHGGVFSGLQETYGDGCGI